MTALVNGEPRTLADGTTLDLVVADITDRATGVAAAVNGDVVPRRQWTTTVLTEGAEVEVITAVQGG